MEQKGTIRFRVKVKLQGYFFSPETVDILLVFKTLDCLAAGGG